MFDLSGKVAFVTGASGGLGQRAATALLNAGAKVVGIARREDKLSAWQQASGEHAAIVAADLSDRDHLAEVVARCAAHFGDADIVVNAAGINLRQPADDIDAAGWDTTVSINLTVPFFFSQHCAKAMQQKGWGRIIHFASLQTFRAFPGGLAYGATKAGIAQMTRAMAQDWSAKGINVNAIGPGFFPTELTQAVFSDAERAQRNAAQTCIGRNGDLEDIDGPIVFLASEASNYVTGQVLMVDGGFTAK